MILITLVRGLAKSPHRSSKPWAGLEGPNKHISIIIYIDIPNLLGFIVRGFILEYSYPYFCLGAFVGALTDGPLMNNRATTLKGKSLRFGLSK